MLLGEKLGRGKLDRGSGWKIIKSYVEKQGNQI